MEHYGLDAYGIKFFDSKGNGYMDFQNDSGNSMMVIENSGGFVGIGTTDPVRMISLYKNSSDQVLMAFQNATTGAALGNGFVVGIYTAEDAWLWNFHNSDMLFATNNLERMRILSGGNVGIGTDNPGEKLSVDGNIETYDGHYMMTDKVRAIDGDGLYLVNDIDEGIFVDSTGFVGIGTDVPTSELEVAGIIRAQAIQVQAVAARDNSGLVLEDNAGNGIFIEDGGQVGIGIGAPTALLHVNGTFRVQNGTDIDEISIDGTLAGNSDDAVPTEQAVKTYVDGHTFDHGGLSGLEDNDHPQYRPKQENIQYRDGDFSVDATDFYELSCFVVDSTSPIVATMPSLSPDMVGYEVEFVTWANADDSTDAFTIQADLSDIIGDSSPGGTYSINPSDLFPFNPLGEQFSIKLKVVETAGMFVLAIMCQFGNWGKT